MSERLEFERDGSLENLHALREFVVSACQGIGVDQSVCFAMELAVDEACTNIVTHGYAGELPGPIHLTFQSVNGEVVVTITDYGRPFSPDEAPPPDLDSNWEERRIGGLGVYLMRKVMDEVEYQPGRQDGNRLTLRKRLKPAEARSSQTP